MPEFHETGYGKRFFEAQLPKLIREIGRVADELGKLVGMAEDLTTGHLAVEGKKLEPFIRTLQRGDDD
jgi:hypothetical protein